MALIVALGVVALAVWLTQQGDSEPAPSTTPSASGTASLTGSSLTPGSGSTPIATQPTVGPLSTGASTPRSNLPSIEFAELPRQARQVVEKIHAGGPFRYAKDGAVFGNRERLLPQRPRGYYHEYTVDKPGSDDRGPWRIVAGDGGDLYWTQDHYDSFAQIIEEP